MRKILLAVDGSDHANRATELAGELSAGLDAIVDIVHVVPDRDLVPVHVHPFVANYTQLEETYNTRRNLLEESGHRMVFEAAETIRESGGQVGSEEILFGRPDQEIASKADRSEVDFIVMGRRGLGEVKGLFMGSVSTRVGQLSEKTLVTTE